MRLLQWNIQWCRGMDGVVDPARIARVARELGDPDVCCFQEVAVNFPALAGSSDEDQAMLLGRAFSGYSAHLVSGVD
ncbi:MAG: endonuclease/exonuclease/phosphatase family protein, partial [Burkholderiales bacterium]